jgi:hypothetical protein
MPLCNGLPENSSGSLPFENTLNVHQLRDVIPLRKPLSPSVDEPEQSTTRNNKRRSDAAVLNRPRSYSLSSRSTIGSNMYDTHHHEHGDVRTLPRKSSIKIHR